MSGGKFKGDGLDNPGNYYGKSQEQFTSKPPATPTITNIQSAALAAPPKLFQMMDIYTDYFKTQRSQWEPEMAKAISESKDKLPVISLFYESPSDFLKGEIRKQHPEIKDMETMYPQLLHVAKQLKMDFAKNKQYLLVINVNNGVSVGHSFQINTIL
jgi:hypothetical protein